MATWRELTWYWSPTRMIASEYCPVEAANVMFCCWPGLGDDREASTLSMPGGAVVGAVAAMPGGSLAGAATAAPKEKVLHCGHSVRLLE